jgi:hypothetical protein
MQSFSSADEFLVATEELLLKEEARNNVVLGLSYRWKGHDGFWATVIYNGTVPTVLAMSCTPGRLVLADFGVEPSKEDLKALYEESKRFGFTIVTGPQSYVNHFVSGRTHQNLVIYECRNPIPTKNKSLGRMVVATMKDVNLVVKLIDEFGKEVDSLQPTTSPEQLLVQAESLIVKESVML